MLDPLLVGLALADVAGDGREEPYAAVGGAVSNDNLGNGDFLAFGIEHCRLTLPQPLESCGRQRLVLDDFAHPSRRDLGAQGALSVMLRHTAELAAGGIQVNPPSLRVGHPDVVAGRLQDLHQASALLLGRAHALTIAGSSPIVPETKMNGTRGANSREISSAARPSNSGMEKSDRMASGVELLSASRSSISVATRFHDGRRPSRSSASSASWTSSRESSMNSRLTGISVIRPGPPPCRGPLFPRHPIRA